MHKLKLNSSVTTTNYTLKIHFPIHQLFLRFNYFTLFISIKNKVFRCPVNTHYFFFEHPRTAQQHPNYDSFLAVRFIFFPLKKEKNQEKKVIENCVASSSFLRDMQQKSARPRTYSHPFLFFYFREIIFFSFSERTKNGTKRRCDKRGRKGQANGEGGPGEVEREWCRIGLWTFFENF